MAQSYRVKCRKSAGIKDAREISLRNGRPGLRDTCDSCGTKVFRIGRPRSAHNTRSQRETETQL